MGSGHLASEQQELLLRVLSAKEACSPFVTQNTVDVFGGDDLFRRFYMSWLGSVGFTVGRGISLAPFHPSLSDEGRSVLLMPRATREPAWVDLPMREWSSGAPGRSRRCKRRARGGAVRLRARDHAAAAPVRARAHRQRSPRDAHQHRPERPPAGARVVWSAAFRNERPRDDLFGWLAGRVHRWENWGELARSKGARTLTAHLLTLLVVSPVGCARAADPVSRS